MPTADESENVPTPVTADQEFLEQAHQQQPSVWREFWEFLRDNRKWWLAPLMIVLLIVSALLLLTQSAAAPFIYVLF